jgi:hypothetical protein
MVAGFLANFAGYESLMHGHDMKKLRKRLVDNAIKDTLDGFYEGTPNLLANTGFGNPKRDLWDPYYIEGHDELKLKTSADARLNSTVAAKIAALNSTDVAGSKLTRPMAGHISMHSDIFQDKTVGLEREHSSHPEK